MKYYVYIIKSRALDKYYIGFSADIGKRLRYHNRGANRSTKRWRPWKLVYQESFADKASAWKRERQIKSYKGGEAFKKLLS